MMVDEIQIEAMLAAYLETLAGYPDEIVAAACGQTRRMDWRLPPSAGQIYAICGELNAQRLAAARKALPAPAVPEHDAPRISQERWDDLKRMIAAADLGSRCPQ